jgi:hypothetical protein
MSVPGESNLVSSYQDVRRVLADLESAESQSPVAEVDPLRKLSHWIVSASVSNGRRSSRDESFVHQDEVTNASPLEGNESHRVTDDSFDEAEPEEDEPSLPPQSETPRLEPKFARWSPAGLVFEERQVNKDLLLGEVVRGLNISEVNKISETVPKKHKPLPTLVIERRRSVYKDDYTLIGPRQNAALSLILMTYLSPRPYSLEEAYQRFRFANDTIPAKKEIYLGLLHEDLVSMQLAGMVSYDPYARRVIRVNPMLIRDDRPNFLSDYS